MYHVITSSYQRVNPLLDKAKTIELDLGCGKGGFSLALAERFPEREIVAADIMLGRIRRIDKKVERLGYENVTLLRASAMELLGFQLAPNSIDRIHILCPDPWPKARHRGKRLLCSDFYGRLRNVLKPDGILHISTDDEPYLKQILAAMENYPRFELYPEGIADIADIKTEFERKWLELGKSVTHLSYRVK